jgi:acyl-coenzyme A thioesterase PaaI-like protein
VTAARLRRWIAWWPPFVCSGIRLRHLSDDFRTAEVELRQRWFNRNYVGSHFGGSLFAMVDPFWMIMLIENLGRQYIVWDQAGEIDFLRPGKGTVRARFELDEATLDSIRAAAADGEKHLRWFETTIVDAGGETVARVRKQLYVRLKPAFRAGNSR